MKTLSNISPVSSDEILPWYTAISKPDIDKSVFANQTNLAACLSSCQVGEPE